MMSYSGRTDSRGDFVFNGQKTDKWELLYDPKCAFSKWLKSNSCDWKKGVVSNLCLIFQTDNISQCWRDKHWVEMGEKFKRSQEWQECLSGHRHYVEQSGAKWGWTTRQQSVLRCYPQTPPPTLSKPPCHHFHCVPLLCGVIPPATQQWPHHHLLEGEWRSGRQRGCGVLFMLRGLQSLSIFYGCTASLLQMSVGCDVVKNKTCMKQGVSSIYAPSRE